MTTIHVRKGEFVVTYGDEQVTIRYLAKVTGLSKQSLWGLHKRGRLTVSRVMELQRMARVRKLARAHGITPKQAQARRALGWTAEEAATTSVRQGVSRHRRELQSTDQAAE